MDGSRSKPRSVVFVGRGIFGICGAIECKQRFGTDTEVISIDGEVEAESSTNDVSKITRGDYGKDDLYTRLHNLAIQRWKQKERQWFGTSPADSYFHWTGVSLLSQTPYPMAPESYEACSYETVRKVDPALASKCQVFRSESDVQTLVNPRLTTFKSGYNNPNAGWIESGAVLRRYVEEARQCGVVLINESVAKVHRDGVHLVNGRYIKADVVVVSCGAWTPFLLPETRQLLRATMQPVFLFEPRSNGDSPELAWLGRDQGGGMSPLTLDMAQTGFYCFPFQKRARVLKFGHHGEGYPVSSAMTAQALRQLEFKVRHLEEARFVDFLNTVSPGFSENWMVNTFRLCQYCDSLDSHFLIDKLPSGIICASGGSGHGFKFGPVIGELIADCVEGKTNSDPVMREAAQRFRWRTLDPRAVLFEQARNTTRILDDVGPSKL